MIKVIKSGIQLTIQDLGRVGFRHLGVSRSGSLDTYAHIIANRLLNNTDNAAVLELTVGLCELQFQCDTVIALHGADLKATLDGHPLYPGWSYPIKAMQTLKFATGRGGSRAYIAVKGGIECPEVMGSKSTDLGAAIGGFNGRALQSGDVLAISPYTKPWLCNKGALTPPKRNIIRLHVGPHYELLTPECINAFCDTAFTINPNSNRMGVRLDHKNADIMQHTLSLPSVAVAPGSIQLPPDGNPIVLLNDGQTTGGYPLIAHVIEADLHQFAQFRTADPITFEFVSLEQANAAKNKLDAHLAQLKLSLSRYWD
ncbi:KipI antagonist [Pseudoalteromonas sp. P1-16-1b]|uniref:5-oxoprolinase subunit C family protein n=1 Tax=unclassified Pseudoalteromonas TaxID=194690 RepID=UPI0006D655F3|nr:MULTISPECIES: biotin-dependent carboxyltransferase family protein [unclassified Pseudoalteromonas]KPZ63465.1 KipI antagonist [Pseudoalteromonas sp. P1-16-1b]NWL16269.1 biotin-dependent carboxyltransferase family protein [Pseudoalteromonas sp. Scap03]QLE81390.1 biotin-dependent carboxyltransferase family protein [Pseudoalteromonas sp. Scap25]QLE89334.1 biotin-dependent carboxyltransferase family protein [Pseudoalteromonas sp. Scap06]